MGIGSGPLAQWRAVWIGPHGVRSGWRVLLFGLVFGGLLFGLLKAANFVLHRFHVRFSHPSGMQPAEELLIGQSLILIAAALALVLLARIEKSPVSRYWLPWNRAFRSTYWQGVLWGMGLDASIMLAITAAGGYSIDSGTLSGSSLVTSACYGPSSRRSTALAKISPSSAIRCSR
jgi:hypothetical protein